MPPRFPRGKIKEFAVFKKLDTPAKVQDFLDAMPLNFETAAETCRSPLMTLKHNEAHCMEGAMLAAAAFWYHGQAPLLLDLKTGKSDDDHVLALFKQKGRWGAISKTNHAVLRYRDPVFKSARELALSYFNEYFLDNGRKTMRSFSEPFDLRRYGNWWLDLGKDAWQISRDLDKSKHREIASPKIIRRLRRADDIEIKAGKIVEWKSRAKPRKER